MNNLKKLSPGERVEILNHLVELVRVDRSKNGNSYAQPSLNEPLVASAENQFDYAPGSEEQTVLSKLDGKDFDW